MFIKPINILQDIRDSYIKREKDGEWYISGFLFTTYDKKTDALHAKESVYQFIKDGCRQDLAGVLEVNISYLGHPNQYYVSVDEYNNGKKIQVYASEIFTYEKALLAQEAIDLFIQQNSSI